MSSLGRTCRATTPCLFEERGFGLGMQQDLINLNRAIALERIGGDEDLLREIALLFLDDYPNLMSAIRQAVASKDAEGLERAAHSLKGSVSNFGADMAQRAALELEMMGRNRQLTNADSAFARLEKAMASLLPEMQALAQRA